MKKISSFISSALKKFRDSEQETLQSELSTLAQIDIPAFLTYLDLTRPELREVKQGMDKGDAEKALEKLHHYMRARRSPCFSLKWWEKNRIIEEVKQKYPEAYEKTLDIADKICNGRFVLFNHHLLEYEGDIHWNQSHKSGRSWDVHSCPDLQAFESLSEGEDIQFIWELNRHRHFLDLGKAYWLTDQEKYVQTFLYHLVSWIDQNPFPRGINWSNPFEVSLRCLFWLFGYFFFISFKHLDALFHLNWLRYIYFHGYTLEAHLKRIASPHPQRTFLLHEIIAQAAVLYLIGALFPEFKKSKEWRDESTQILQGGFASLLPSAKSIIEDSLAGILVSVELYLITLITRRVNRLYLLPQLTSLTERALEYIMDLIKPCGQLPRIGDEHLSCLIRSTSPMETGFRHLLTLGAVLLNRGDFKIAVGDFQEESLWLLGKEGAVAYQELPAKSPKLTSKSPPDGSYAVMRNDWGREANYFFITRGSHPGPNSEIKEITHADALSFEVSVFGIPYIVDAGPYSKESRSKWNSYFRHYMAHNSILVDSRGLKELDIESSSRERFHAELSRWVSSERFDFVRGYHTGFQKLSSPVLHHRAVFFKKSDYWILHDLLTGEGTHLFEQYFHFSPTKLSVDFAQKKVQSGRLYDPTLAIIPLHGDKMDVTFHAGGEDPGDGWITNGYKSVVEAPLIKYGRNSSLPTSFNTILYPQPPATEITILGREGEVRQGEFLVSVENAVGLEVQLATGTDYFILSHQGPQKLSFKEFTVEGELFFIRKDTQDQVAEVCLHQGSHLSVGDLVLFQAQGPIWDLSFRFTEDRLEVWATKSLAVTIYAPNAQQVFINGRKGLLKKVKDHVAVEIPKF